MNNILLESTWSIWIDQLYCLNVFDILLFRSRNHETPWNTSPVLYIEDHWRKLKARIKETIGISWAPHSKCRLWQLERFVWFSLLFRFCHFFYLLFLSIYFCLFPLCLLGGQQRRWALQSSPRSSASASPTSRPHEAPREDPCSTTMHGVQKHQEWTETQTSQTFEAINEEKLKTDQLSRRQTQASARDLMIPCTDHMHCTCALQTHRTRRMSRKWAECSQWVMVLLVSMASRVSRQGRTSMITRWRHPTYTIIYIYIYIIYTYIIYILHKHPNSPEIGPAFSSMFMFIVIFVLLKTYENMAIATCLYHGGVFWHFIGTSSLSFGTPWWCHCVLRFATAPAILFHHFNSRTIFAVISHTSAFRCMYRHSQALTYVMVIGLWLDRLLGHIFLQASSHYLLHQYGQAPLGCLAEQGAQSLVTEVQQKCAT